ncbi:uncharacterized protein Dwil_GK12300 [Drosophila willistoni]|uniref:Amine oxidase domain-containing protein n=1 Tax=Drosophila willistoni TaxID=7260 RepID=B4N6K4_DROWI|nr:spermine oxidase [Drosophila willistoni]EDW79993.1 uncharacterized protein Dwil_GK12300 [Drosophila willistoni]
MGKTKETARIVIIGAGASGLAAGTRLLELGFKDVQIIDAKDRIGGRIHTVEFGDNVVDLGGQWCHGEKGNVIYELVKDLNVLDRTGDFYSSTIYVRSNKEILPQQTSNILRSIAAKYAPEGTEGLKGSLDDYVTPKYWSEVAKQLPSLDSEVAKEALRTIKLMLCSWKTCNNLADVSPISYALPSEGDNLLNWRDKGFASFFTILMKADPNKPDDFGVLNGHVTLNKCIAEINLSGSDDVTIRCENGEIIKADHVIYTGSLGYLKEHHRTLFVPALPEAKVRAIDGLKLGTLDKFYLEFAAAPTPNEYVGFDFLWLDKDLEDLRKTEYFWLESIRGFHRVTHQPRLLEGWIIGEHAQHMETLTEEKVQEGLLWLFSKFLNYKLPKLKGIKRTQFYMSPYFRGSVSYRSILADKLQTGPWDLETPLTAANGRPRLQFAGEASSKTHNSSVNGAVETGWREADRLKQYYLK